VTIFTSPMLTATQLRLLNYQAKHAASFGETSEARSADSFQRDSILRRSRLLDKRSSWGMERELACRIRRWWSTTQVVIPTRRTRVFRRVVVELEDKADNTVWRSSLEISAR